MGYMWFAVAWLAFGLVVSIMLGRVLEMNARAEAESELALKRELSRIQHPSQFEVDWTPPHGMERPDV